MNLSLPGPAGALEAAAHGETNQAERWLVMCHPHPQFGGSMHNNVVDAVCDAARAQGYAALTFNFRGVGRSAGSYDGGRGEVDDLLAAMAFIDDEFACPQNRLIVAGYSFGAAVAARAFTRGITPRAGLWISPPITVMTLPDEARDWNGPKALLCGQYDEYCPPAEAEALCAAAQPPIYFRAIPDADHFYPGVEPALTTAAADFLRTLD